MAGMNYESAASMHDPGEQVNSSLCAGADRSGARLVAHTVPGQISTGQGCEPLIAPKLNLQRPWPIINAARLG